MTITDPIYILDIRWKLTNVRGPKTGRRLPNIRCGYKTAHENIPAAHHKLRATLAIVAKAKAEHVQDWDIQTKPNGDCYIEFNVFGQQWNYHLYQADRREKKLRKFGETP